MRRTYTVSVLLGVCVFAVYAWGACRTIYVGDSGELVTAAATLGIPHPSGYPLFVLLGKLWITLVPLGSVAYRMSLYSGFFAAATVTVLFWTMRRSGVSLLAGLVGSLSLAFAPSFWSQATIQRVYTLNSLFVVLVVACALEWYRSGERAREEDRKRAQTSPTRSVRWLVIAALLAGLGATNHTVMAVVGLAVGLFALWTEPQLLRRPLALLACVAAGLIGTLPYAYLPWRSRQDPWLDWGNPETFDALVAAVLRRDFWHRSWIESPSDWWPIMRDFVHGLGEETLLIGACLAVVALVSRSRSRPVLLPLLIVLLNLVVLGLHGSRPDIFIWHRYYIPAYIMVALLIAWGSERLVDRWGQRAFVLLVLPLALLVLGWQRFDRSDFAIAEDFSRQLLASLPPGAHLAASDDNILFVLMYLQRVEGVRPDIDLILQGVGGEQLDTLRFDPDEDPLFFTHHPNWNIEGLEIVPVGLVFQTVRVGAARPVLPVLRELRGAWDDNVPKDYLAQNLVGHFHYMSGLNYQATDWPRTEREFERARLAAPRNDVLFFNLGLIYRRNGLLRRSLASFERAAAINPRDIPSQSRANSVDQVEILQTEILRLERLEGQVGGAAGLGRRETSPTDVQRHSTLADLLEARGETLLARGHRLLAQESIAKERLARP